MKLALVMLAAAAIAWPPAWWRETNSHAASARGARAYEEKQYDAASKAYTRAEQLTPSARNAFNLGTAEIAAGNREQGSAHLAEAIQDPALRSNAYFNRGNSALEAKSFEHAIRDYADALRANPQHAGAKRNLEIAMQRQRQQQQPSPNGKQGQNQQKQQPQQQQQAKQPSQSGQPDLEALLRSVQQQEQEELRRMKGKASEGKVGW